MKEGNIQQKELPAGKLSIIDDKLEQFAKRHNTHVTSPEKNYYPAVKDSMENRLIEWGDSIIRKAIVINPHQDTSGFDPNSWDVTNIAWAPHAPSYNKPFWERTLVKKATAKSLEMKIDELLSQSEENLKNLKLEDLK